MTARPDLRLAIAQMDAALDGTTARLDWLHDVLPRIADRGADLLVLPELFACGYNIGDAVVERAEPADGPTFLAVAEMARASRIAIAYGFAERSEDALYNAALIVGPEGVRLGHHRKLVLPPGFEADHFTTGRGAGVFAYRGLNVGLLICYDVEFPETVRHLAVSGADLVVVPTALGEDWAWVADTMVPTRAYENGVYLAYANPAGVENGMRFLGQSVIAAPDGVEIARAGRRPDILFADVSRERAVAARRRLPYLQDRKAIRLD